MHAVAFTSSSISCLILPLILLPAT